jgi:hypothetical protein
MHTIPKNTPANENHCMKDKRSLRQTIDKIAATKLCVANNGETILAGPKIKAKE